MTIRLKANTGATPGDEKQPPQRLNRALHGLTIVSFFFPFATVKGCSGEVARSYTGFELIGKDLAMLLAGVLLLAALLFALSFRRRVLTTMRRGMVQAFKALLSALAIQATFVATGMTFLFYAVHVEIGFYLCMGSWFGLYLLSMNTAIRQVVLARKGCRESPPPFGLALAVLLALAHLLTIWWSEPNSLAEVMLGTLAGLSFAAPVILMAMLAAVRYRQGRPSVSGPS